MLLLSLFRRKEYHLPLWKAIVFPFTLTISGVVGTLVLYFIETGQWGGISFYGSVFLIPILVMPTSFAIKTPYTKLLDYAVPQICLMLACMKVHCFISGCCGGILLYTTEAGREIHFPSQVVEIIVALLIMVLILFIDSKNIFKNALYGVFFLVYGLFRLILNFFRAGISPFVWILPAGHFWSIISIVLGALWICFILLKKDVQNNE